MSDEQQEQDRTKLSELTDENGDSDTRTSDEIYQETRRDSGGTETIEKEMEPPTLPSVDSDADVSFDERNEEFRQFWRSRFAGLGYGYDYHRPAMKFGYRLAYSEEYGEDEWADSEDEFKQMWNDVNDDEHHWDEFEVLVKHGWNTAMQYQREVELENPLIEEGTTEAEAKEAAMEDEDNS